MHRSRGPAYRIETPRTRLRCFVPADFQLVERAVSESLEHLRPTMTWTVHEPLPREQRIELMRTYRGHFDLGGDYNFGAFDRQSPALFGAAVLKMGASDVSEREVGFWVHVNHINQGFATEMTSALLRVAFEVEGLDTVELRCDPTNTRSAHVAEKLGFAGPVLDPLSHPVPGEGKRDTHVYTLSRVEYQSSPARNLQIEAYDVLDQRIL
jgi:RimJ/RimL family protein N-acetyltransferase